MKKIIQNYQLKNILGKVSFLILLFMSVQNVVLGQSMSPSAIVDFSSIDKGMLIPRMSTTQRLQIFEPAEGLFVYDLTLHSFFYFNGGTWKNSNSTASTSLQNAWLTSGNTDTLLTHLPPFLGTRDYNPLVFSTNGKERMRLTENGVLQFSDGVMNVGDNAIVGTDLTIKRNVLLNAESGTTLINGITTIGGPTLNPTTFTGTVKLNKSLDVTEATKLRNTLTVVGETNINNNLTVTETIVTKELNVRKNVLLNAEDGTTLINGTTTIGGPLMNSSTFTGNVKLNQTLAVTGATKLQNTLIVDGSTNINNDLTVTGVTVGKELNIRQNVILNAEDGVTLINGTSTIGGPTMNPSIFTGNVKLNRTFDVTGATKLRNTLSVDGSTDINNDLNVTGTNYTKNLTVKQEVLLNAEGGNTTINGTSIIGGPLFNPTSFTGYVTMKDVELNNLLIKNILTVRGPAFFKNIIEVDGAAGLHSTLTVDGAARLNNSLSVLGITDLRSTLNVFGVSNLQNALNVDGTTSLRSELYQYGIAYLKSDLNVDGTTNLISDLNVDGTTNLNNTLTVSGLTNINNQLVVESNVADGGFIATFSNLNGGNGDGIDIKLGKSKSEYEIPTIPELITQQEINEIKNLIRCDYTLPKIDLLEKIIISLAFEDIKIIAGLTISIGNLMIGFINTSIGLPVHIDLPLDIGRINILPAIPTINLSDLGIPNINLISLDFWGIPNFCLTDGVGQTPLNNKNEFIRFSDQNDSKMGSIRAESVTNWAKNYLNPSFLFSLRGAITSSKIDKFHAQWHFKGLLSAALSSYTKIGVEYTSGNGDYAEWLERIDTQEFISAGDIVGVIGGKITKDLTKAEQVLVVSHNPIVLGNIPPEGTNFQGNNIAFMGQVPVKIIGPVTTGDFIVGNNETPGYGFAKKQKDMTVEDFKYVVGRSWENNENDGPIKVNTVVGVHNGDYLKILKKYEEKFKDAEQRLESIESKVNILMNKMEAKTSN